MDCVDQSKYQFWTSTYWKYHVQTPTNKRCRFALKRDNFIENNEATLFQVTAANVAFAVKQ